MPNRSREFGSGSQELKLNERPRTLSENLLRNRLLCLDQADGFLAAAERIGTQDFPHIVYHLSLLALEEVGKSSMIAGCLATGDIIENQWIDKGLESHRRKLQWAIWSPIARIDPKDFEQAREFAERAHAMRLASLYVDAKAELVDPQPSDLVSVDDAERVLSLARARLEYERAKEAPDLDAHQTDELMVWFLETMADPERSRQLLSKAFIDQYHLLDCDARSWVSWAHAETLRLDQEARALLQAELGKEPAPIEQAKPKWRVLATVYTPSHSVRTKALNKWNAQIDVAKLLWSGKKDRLTLELTLPNNAALASLHGRSVHLAKLIVACLNIGTIGYFWFEQPGFERKMFDQIRDLENGRNLQIEAQHSFWGDQRAVALTEEHIDHAIRCMMAFAPLAEEDAAPIFRPYYDGLALIAKSDTFYDFDELARRAFISSLAGALARYGGWDGSDGTFRSCFDEAFMPIMSQPEHRDQMFRVLTREGDPKETSLDNLRSAKQLTDLYLILVGRRTWSALLERGKDL